MVMCMLDIAVRLQHSLERNNNSDIVDKLLPLAEEIERVLET